jgi:hypothetical protein
MLTAITRAARRVLMTVAFLLERPLAISIGRVV